MDIELLMLAIPTENDHLPAAFSQVFCQVPDSPLDGECLGIADRLRVVGGVAEIC